MDLRPKGCARERPFGSHGINLVIEDDRKRAVEKWVASKLTERRANGLRLPIVVMAVVQVVVVAALGIYAHHCG